MKRIIHINQLKIRQNQKKKTVEPVVTAKTYKKNVYGHEVEFKGGGKVVYSPHKPLSCGARVWIETYDPVIIHNTVTGESEEL